MKLKMQELMVYQKKRKYDDSAEAGVKVAQDFTDLSVTFICALQRQIPGASSALHTA